MSNNNNGRANNARLKYIYFDGLLGADSQTDDTVKKKEASIKLFDVFIEHQDYGIYNKTIAKKFKIELFKREGKLGNQIKRSTVEFHLSTIQEFLKWVRDQKGYKNKIILRDIDYLNLTAEERKKLCSSKKILVLPESDDVIQQINLIPKATEIDLRDRAIFAFLMCTGVRAKALISLPIVSFNAKQMFVDQNPDYGVKTKNSEHIISKFLNRGEKLVEEFLSWYRFLKYDKKFEDHYPLFPKPDRQTKGNTAIYTYKNVSSKFWKSQSSLNRMLQKRAKPKEVNYFHPHSYRHSAILFASDKCVTRSEYKAVSQSFGHRDVFTTSFIYGNLSERDVLKKMDIVDARDLQKLNNILRNIDSLNSGTTNNSGDSLINDMIRVLEDYGINYSSGEKAAKK